MRVSLLQPKIIRGNIEHNLNRIQRLIEKSIGDLLVLPEYVLTGSLILDKEADLSKWIKKNNESKENIKVPQGKTLILNSLIYNDEKIYNCCELLPSGKKQMKLYPDETEIRKGITPGTKHQIIRLYNKKIKIIICSDLKYWNLLNIEDVDFLVWIYHFTKENYNKRMTELKKIIKVKKKPILVSSITSDKNIGFSTYIDQNRTISLSEDEGILELEI